MWPIFIINLDRAQDRLRVSERLMREAGLDFVRVGACDGTRLSRAAVEAHVGPTPPPFAKRPMTAPEVACFISHRTVWERVARSEWPGAVILEDDFEFGPDFKHLLSSISEAPPDWDILKFYSNKPKRLLAASSLAGRYRIGVPRVLPMSTVAYAITRPAAAALAGCCPPFRRPVDLYLKHWWEHGGCVKLVMPAPVGRRHDHLETSAIRPAPASGALLSRFVRNILYQLAFKLNTARHAARRPMHARWVDEGTGQGDVR